MENEFDTIQQVKEQALASPGKVFWNCLLDVDGGCVWFCAKCKNFAFPNRPCLCGYEDEVNE